MARSSNPRAPKGAAAEFERITILVTPEYKAGQLDEMKTYFNMSASDLGRHALQELWRRKNEPEVGSIPLLIENGFSQIVRDHRHHDFSSLLENSEILFLKIREIAFFLTLYNHRSELFSRLDDATKSTFFLFEEGMDEEDEVQTHGIIEYAKNRSRFWKPSEPGSDMEYLGRVRFTKTPPLFSWIASFTLITERESVTPLVLSSPQSETGVFARDAIVWKSFAHPPGTYLAPYPYSLLKQQFTEELMREDSEDVFRF